MSAKKRKKGASPFVCIIPIAAAIVFAVFSYGKYHDLSLALQEEEIMIVSENSPSEGTGRGFSGLELFSSNAILFDPNSGDILYGKDPTEIIYPASLTKIMTALVAIENISDLDSSVTMKYEDYAGLYEQNAAMAGFSLGETVTIRDLLYATLLPSGAEAATALANAAADSNENFVSLMNERAASLGMDNTHFVNVTGLHDDDHYTTVSDLALLLREASKNADFMEPYTALRYTTTATPQHPQGLKLTSTLVPRLAQLSRDREPIIGNKTGYTEEAQLCLASIAEKDGKRIALITVGAEGDGRSHPTQLEDAYMLYGKALK